MVFPLRPLLDPPFEQSDLIAREPLPHFGRWHPVVFIRCRDERNHFALARFARNNGVIARLKFSEGILLDIESETRFSFVLVRTVAGVTVFRKNRANIAIEVDLSSFPRRSQTQKGQEQHRDKRGRRLPDRVEKDSVVLAYEGLDGTIRRTHIQFDPLPDFTSNAELQFNIDLRPKERATFQFVISCDTPAETVSTGYARAVAAARQEFDSATDLFPKISSSNSRFSDWISRSVSDIQMMTLGNPEPNYPYAGVPWFSTVFGRDGIITALQTLWLSPSIARGVLEYLAAAQAQEVIPSIEAEPGKILHEMRRGEMAALREVPFGCYYGSVDSTPLFIMLAGAYYDRTADRTFLERLWPHVDKALR